MSLLKREDWEKLRNEDMVAFTGMREKVFTTLLDTVYGPKKKGNPGGNPGNGGKLDDTDVLMVYLGHDMAPTHTEPGIRPKPIPIP